MAGEVPRHRRARACRHFGRKIDAQHWLDSVAAAVQTGTYVDPQRSRITVERAGASPGWPARSTSSRPLGPATRASSSTHVLPRWGDVQLVRVEHGDIQAWLAGLAAAGQSGASVRKAHGVLSGILGLAVRDRRLPWQPGARDGPAAAGEQGRRRYLTAAQVEELADAAGPRDGSPSWCSSYCGLRWSELAALRVRHVDLLRRRLDDRARRVTEVDGRRLVWGTPKSHERRSVPLPRFLVDELAAALAGTGPEDLAFPVPTGRRPAQPQRAAPRWFDEAAPCDRPAGPDAARAAAHRGLARGERRRQREGRPADARTASAAMTLDRYADLFDDDLDDVAERLGRRPRVQRCGPAADFLRTEPKSIREAQDQKRLQPSRSRGLQRVETRGIEPLTPALQRRCSAN